MTQLRGKVTRLKSKLISNQDQWVETFKSIQEPKQLLMVNAVESTIIDVDESYRHNCLSLYFYYILSIFDYLTHSPLNRRNRPCGSRSFLPIVTSSVLTVKDNFLR